MKLDPFLHSANKIEDFFFDYQLNYLKKMEEQTQNEFMKNLQKTKE